MTQAMASRIGLTSKLREHFGFRRFRPGQEKVVRSALAGRQQPVGRRRRERLVDGRLPSRPERRQQERHEGDAREHDETGDTPSPPHCQSVGTPISGVLHAHPIRRHRRHANGGVLGWQGGVVRRTL